MEPKEQVTFTPGPGWREVRSLDDPGPQPPEDWFHASVTIELTKHVAGRHTFIKVQAIREEKTQTEAVKEAVEAALAELKGKP